MRPVPGLPSHMEAAGMEPDPVFIATPSIRRRDFPLKPGSWWWMCSQGQGWRLRVKESQWEEVPETKWLLQALLPVRILLYPMRSKQTWSCLHLLADLLWLVMPLVGTQTLPLAGFLLLILPTAHWKVSPGFSLHPRWEKYPRKVSPPSVDAESRDTNLLWL